VNDRQPGQEDIADGHHRPAGADVEGLPVDPDVGDRPATRTARRRRRLPEVLRERWDILLVIAAGGALGSLARYGLTVAFPHADGQVPWGTWLANITGAFVLGTLMVFILDVWPPSRYVRPFLGVGVLGGYTTFSTMALDSRTLLVAGRPMVAAGYLFGSVLAGLSAVWAGVLLARTAVAVTERRHLRQHPDRAATTGHPSHTASAEDPDLDPDADADVRSRR
jgi:CrcB protein